MPNRLTQEEFIRRVTGIFGDRFDFSGSVYISGNKDVTYHCPKHGLLTKKATLLLDGYGCRECYNESIGDRCRSNTYEFVKKAKAAHGDKYDYSKTKYTKALEKVVITCRKHGDFKQKASGHLTGYGCPECGFEICRTHKLDSIGTVKNKIEKVHGKGKFDLSKIKYKNSQTKVEVICFKHGSFFIKPNDLINGVGCAKCAYEENGGCFSLETLTDENRNNKCYLYHVEITADGSTFNKVGVTTKSVESRFRNCARYGFSYKVLSVVDSTLEDCLTKERDIFDALKSIGELYKIRTLKNTSIGGWTECFYPSEEVDDVISNYFGESK